MKSVEQQLEDERQDYILGQRKKGFAEATILTSWKESVMVADTVENQLSNAKKLNQSVGVKESVDIRESRPRIRRKNGTAIREAGTEDRVQKYMKKGFTLRESYVMCGMKDPGPSAKLPASFVEGLAAKWKKYARISEADALTLASRGISPE
jgi:hypothetical protein